jgi:hypothetical protein
MSRQTGHHEGMLRTGEVAIVAGTASCAVVLKARQPVDRAGAMENAHGAFPTAPWTAHRPRRPQRPKGVLLVA